MTPENKKRLSLFVASLQSRGYPVIYLPHSDNSWILELQLKANSLFPALFFDFLASCSFPQFDWAGLTVFGNSSSPEDSHTTIQTVSFQDPILARALQQNHLLQFARPDTGSYDPVCFAPAPNSRADRPIIQLDHESILVQNKIRHTRTIASSFRDLIQKSTQTE